MSTKAVNRGDSQMAVPGTSKQTGNTAPKFPWKTSPIGRTAVVLFHAFANFAGYTDDSMAKQQKFPPREDFMTITKRIMPWFPGHYNQWREAKAKSIGYTGKLEPFNGGDAENRVRYSFVTPGSRKRDEKRAYGFSTENYISTKQHAKLKVVWERCSVEVFERLATGKSISKEEAEAWGALAGDKLF